MFFGASVIIGIVSLLRTSTAIAQTLTGELKLLCLEVVDGRLMQTPFRESCMKPINYPILILTFAPLMILPGIGHRFKYICISILNIRLNGFC